MKEREPGKNKCTWAVNKSQYVAEMRLLRWMSGVTKLDRIRNESIRWIAKVGEIAKKGQESSLKWYGHVLRREKECVGKRVMAIEVPWKRRRGSPKRKWFRYVYGITLGATTEIRIQDTAVQAVVHHGRSTSGVGEFGGSTEIRGVSINSGHRRPENRKLSMWVGTSKEKLTFRKPRGPPSYHLNPASIILIWVQRYVSYLGVATD